MHLLQKFNAQQALIDICEPLFYCDPSGDLDLGDPVYRIVFNTQSTNLSYKVGDALGVFPKNSPQVIDEVLGFLGVSRGTLVSYIRGACVLPIEEFLEKYADINKLPAKLLSYFPQELAPNTTLYDALKEFLPRIPLEEFVNSVFPLLPRLYSIASSPYVSPQQIELLVRRVSYEGKFHRRYGVCSTFLCETLCPGKDAPYVYVQPTKHFTLSERSQDRPIVMIGSGTGIAPFKGFVEQRVFLKNPKKNLLFFGERQKNANFYYQEFWHEVIDQGSLEMFLAFSRESEQKIYVQDALRTQSKRVREAYEEGALFFICGRKALGIEVKKALEDILGKEHVRALKEEQRYIVDVY